MQSKKKTVFNVIFLIALFVATMYVILKGQDFTSILRQIKEVDLTYIGLGILMVFLYVCSESVIIKYLLHVFKIDWPLYKCIRYSFIGFFFSCITPFASGGQPAQVLYMKKEKLEVSISTITLMVVTIGYKFVLVLLGTGVLIFGQGLIQSMAPFARYCLYFGLLLNAICVTALAFLVFNPDLCRTLVRKFYFFLGRLRLVKNTDNRLKRLEASMDRYRIASSFIRENLRSIVVVLVLSFIQRIFLFVVTYLVYRSFRLNQHGPVEITILQATISISVDMLPLPGGMGISEALFHQIFSPIFQGSQALTTSAMLISRGISYYALVLISALATIYTHISIGRANKEKRR